MDFFYKALFYAYYSKFEKKNLMKDPSVSFSEFAF